MGDGRLGKCKECTRKDVRANYAANADYYREYDRRRGYRPGERLKTIARAEVHRAIHRGDLVPQPCEMTGEHCGRIEAHHDDYSKPLTVRWLCKKHHGEIHTTNEEAA
jgi:hypothetical protein